MKESVHHNITELNQLFSEGESADKELFAEQRSNIQLIAGDHYAKRGNKFWSRLRDHKDISQDQKIRLTKNHIRKIVHIYKNSISSYSPGVTGSAKDKTNLQHQKTAELVNAVWADAKQEQDLREKKAQWLEDFIGVGEVAAKIFWNPNGGKYLGMQASMDDVGQVEVDEMGQPVASGIAKFLGRLEIERLYGFNLIRPTSCKDIKTSEWLCHRKMVLISEVKGLIDSSESLSPDEKSRMKAKVTESMDQTYVVLEGGSGQFKTTKDQTMLKEWFFRPSPQYPQGYFYITTNDDIIFEGELPFGIYPIVFEGFDAVQTSPRFRSIVKQLRPNQVEINRCASTIAEHQITMGWDKVLIQNGTKLSPGTSFPGVRSFNYSGMTPIVMEGRTGNQYLEYMNSQIDEIYKIALVDEQLVEKEGQFDVYSMLSRNLRDKKKFSIYSDKIENFETNVFKIYTQLAQKYYTPQHLIPAIGKSEYINIHEFKNVDDLCYSVTPVPQSEDGESKLGTQLVLNHLIQYVGPQLGKDDLGKLIRLMPYANDELILEDLTVDYDTAVNYILALDRGEVPPVNEYDPHEYLIKKLTNRKRKPDFSMLSPVIKKNYEDAITIHSQLKVDQEIKIKQAQSQFIPTGGYLVACDFYVPDPQNPQKLPKRVRLPSEALSWLINQLDSQGTNQQSLEGMSQGNLSNMSQMFMQKLQGQQTPQMSGQTSPQGVMNGR